MIKYLITIVLIIAIVVIGQQHFSRSIGQTVTGWGSGIWYKCKSFVERNILNRVTSEIEKRQDIVKEEIKDQTKEVTMNIWERVKGYFVGIFRSVVGQNNP